MSDPRPLTDTQARVLAAINVLAATYPNRTPTLREIGKMANVSTASSVNWAVHRLESLGYVTREPNKHRSIRLTRPT